MTVGGQKWSTLEAKTRQAAQQANVLQRPDSSKDASQVGQGHFLRVKINVDSFYKGRANVRGLLAIWQSVNRNPPSSFVKPSENPPSSFPEH